MQCPKCKDKAKIVDSVFTPTHGETYRKRVCAGCGYIFFTIEFAVENNERFQREFHLAKGEQVAKSKERRRNV